MRWLVVVLAGLYVPIRRRFDQDIDVFRKPVDDLMPLRKGRSALQLECEAKLLKPVKAMHNPVVFFDERWIDALFCRDNPDQVRELRMIVEEITWHEVHSLLARVRKISSLF